jgi:hypothetical protein
MIILRKKVIRIFAVALSNCAAPSNVRGCCSVVLRRLPLVDVEIHTRQDLRKREVHGEMREPEARGNILVLKKALRGCSVAPTGFVAGSNSSSERRGCAVVLRRLLRQDVRSHRNSTRQNLRKSGVDGGTRANRRPIVIPAKAGIQRR